MSFYRNLLAGLAAVALAMPAFADDTTQMQSNPDATLINKTTTTTTTTTETTKINLNTASAKDLMKVKGINAARARAIVAYRKKHGDFRTIDDLSNVRGFKRLNQHKLQEIQAQVGIE